MSWSLGKSRNKIYPLIACPEWSHPPNNPLSYELKVDLSANEVSTIVMKSPQCHCVRTFLWTHRPLRNISYPSYRGAGEHCWRLWNIICIQSFIMYWLNTDIYAVGPAECGDSWMCCGGRCVATQCSNIWTSHYNLEFILWRESSCITVLCDGPDLVCGREGGCPAKCLTFGFNWWRRL